MAVPPARRPPHPPMDALITGEPRQFEAIVKTAFKAGPSREDFLTAVEIARCFAVLRLMIRATLRLSSQANEQSLPTHREALLRSPQ